MLTSQFQYFQLANSTSTTRSHRDITQKVLSKEPHWCVSKGCRNRSNTPSIKCAPLKSQQHLDSHAFLPPGHCLATEDKYYLCLGHSKREKPTSKIMWGITGRVGINYNTNLHHICCKIRLFHQHLLHEIATPSHSTAQFFHTVEKMCNSGSLKLSLDPSQKRCLLNQKQY